jgi:hypothetical protein
MREYAVLAPATTPLAGNMNPVKASKSKITPARDIDPRPGCDT